CGPCAQAWLDQDGRRVGRSAARDKATGAAVGLGWALVLPRERAKSGCEHPLFARSRGSGDILCNVPRHAMPYGAIWRGMAWYGMVWRQGLRPPDIRPIAPLQLPAASVSHSRASVEESRHSGPSVSEGNHSLRHLALPGRGGLPRGDLQILSEGARYLLF